MVITKSSHQHLSSLCDTCITPAHSMQKQCPLGELLQNGVRLLYLDLIFVAAADGGSGRSVRGDAADGLHNASDDV